MNYQLDKQQLFTTLHRDNRFSEYTIEQLEQDLNALSGWHNLVPIQDPRKPTTIEEYKNKQFRYFMSPAAVEVERMTRALEELNLQTAALSSQLFVHILSAVDEISSIACEDTKTILFWWERLQQDFQQLTKNYQDYLRDFYSSHAEHILQTQEFLYHKDQVIRYLRDFVLELQRHADKIRKLLSAVLPDKIERLLSGVLTAQLEAGQARLIERGEDFEQQLKNRIYGFWDTFFHWFVARDDGQSESQHVMEVTNEIIQRILTNAELLIQAHSGGLSRKNEYKKFLQLFADCASLEEAHCLSAVVFGAQQAYHLTGIDPEETYKISSGCYDEQAFLYNLRNRQRPGRVPSVKSMFTDKRMEKEILRQQYLTDKAEERKRLQYYIDKVHLDFSALKEEITPELRRCFLNWITKANATQSKTARTEYGQRYRLSSHKGTCVLHCTDGDLTMPAYCLDFETEEPHG